MIKLDAISKTYRQAGLPVQVLDNISLQVRAGEFVALMGASGAGKTTLLQLLGCLDTPTSGQYLLDEIEVSRLDEDQLAATRNTKLGFVFQTSHFVDYFDLVDNVSLPGFYAQTLTPAQCQERACELLEQVGLGHRIGHVPAALSGGERQRAAIARALFNRPKVILADEPTGNLDAKNTELVMAILAELNATGITILMVTHDIGVTEAADRRIELVDGNVVVHANVAVTVS